MAIPTEEKFQIDANDEEILETFKSWLKESESYHENRLRVQKISEQYYLGNQTERDMLPGYLSNTVLNRIFESVETLVPVATGNAHHFVVMPGGDNEKSVSKADKLQKVLTKKYQVIDMQRKLEDAVRHLLLYRFGVLKAVWSDIKDDVDVEIVDPRLIFVPKLRVDPHDLPYVIEKQGYSYGEMMEFFPKLNPEELGEIEKVEGNEKFIKKQYVVWEVWTDEMVAWISAGRVLEKRANPYWDFEGEEKATYSLAKGNGGELKQKKSVQLVFRNHLDRPQKPYAFLSTFNVGEGCLPETCLVEIAIPIQDSINVQNRQIIDNLRRMGNGQVYVDADSMSKEEADNITNEVGLVIHGEGVASQNKVRRDPGVPIPNAHFSNLQHAETVFDNLMGVHSATRGAAAAKTLGQDLISRQQDYTRIDLITRVVNRAVYRVSNYLVQLMKMYYTEVHVVKIIGEDGAIEFVRMNRDDIEDHIELDVKSGEDLPMDQASLRAEAVQLWQLGALDPTTLFERLKFPNPEKAAERLIAWKQGQLSIETQAKIAEMQAGAALKPPSTPGTGGGKPSPESGRGVETSMNVLQRARQNNGGTAPVAALSNNRG